MSADLLYIISDYDIDGDFLVKEIEALRRDHAEQLFSLCKKVDRSYQS